MDANTLLSAAKKHCELIQRAQTRADILETPIAVCLMDTGGDDWLLDRAVKLYRLDDIDQDCIAQFMIELIDIVQPG